MWPSIDEDLESDEETLKQKWIDAWEEFKREKANTRFDLLYKVIQQESNFNILKESVENEIAQDPSDDEREYEEGILIDNAAEWFEDGIQHHMEDSQPEETIEE